MCAATTLVPWKSIGRFNLHQVDSNSSGGEKRLSVFKVTQPFRVQFTGCWQGVGRGVAWDMLAINDSLIHCYSQTKEHLSISK